MKETAVHSHPFLQKSLTVILVAALIVFSILAGTALSSSADYSETSLADLYEKNVDSTVGLTTSGRTMSRFGYGSTFQAAGSGFILTSDGYILTNYHVIEGSDTVTVATYDGETYDAVIVGYDRNNDIAVLKIDAKGLKPVTLGDSDKLRVGDDVFAIGNPLGELTFSLTHGVVSALSRDIRTGTGTSMSLIQTDCAINSGNSGGALFNNRGEVIGITNAKYSSSGYDEAEIDNVGFAIPVNSVKSIIDSIISGDNRGISGNIGDNHGFSGGNSGISGGNSGISGDNDSITKPYIGVTVSSVYGDPSIDAGALVQSVTSGAPASKAGIQAGDVIVKVDSTEITDSSTLVQVVSASSPGDVLTFTIYRQGLIVKLDVEIGSRT